MAEFCPECWNRINNYSDPPEMYILSWDYDLCEECGEWKRVVVGRRKSLLAILFFSILYRIKKHRNRPKL